MTFYKYRFKWASGPSQWKIAKIESYEIAREHFEGQANTIDSNKFRGIEWSKIKRIPKEFVQFKIQQSLNRIESAKREINEFSKLKTVSIKKSCLICGNGPEKECPYAKGYYKNIGVICSKKKEQFTQMW
jgi:hypothetical protein